MYLILVKIPADWFSIHERSDHPVPVIFIYVSLQVDLKNITVEQIEQSLCDPQTLAQMLAIPDTVNVTELSSHLCGPGVAQSAALIKSALDISTILYKVLFWDLCST